jgi:REP element-mobilizing transposase RayT
MESWVNLAKLSSPEGTAERMSHSHVCCLVHLVFATAERRPVIRDEIKERLHSYLGGIARENGISALAVSGTADHVHLLISLPRSIAVAKAVQLLKSGSSKWVHENFPESKSFAWQEDTGPFRSEFRKFRQQSDISNHRLNIISGSVSRMS